MRRGLKQYLRYELAGQVVFFADLAMLYVLTDVVGIYYLTSSALCFVMSVSLSYILSTRYVFQGHSSLDRHKEMAVFFLLALIRLGGNQLIMWVCTSKLGIYYLLSRFVSALYSKVYNFVTQKLLLDRGKKKERKKDG